MARPERGRSIRSRSDLEALSVVEQEQRIAAVEALGLMRRDPALSLEDAAARAGTTSDTVLRWAQPVLTRTRGGYRAKSRDDLVFPMTMISTEGPVEVLTRSSEERSLVGAHTNAIKNVLRPGGGDASLLAPYQAPVIDGYHFETDVGALVQWWHGGQLDFLELYGLAQ